MLLDWVLVAVTAVTLIYVYLKWNYGYWKKRGVPYESPELLFGSYKDAFLIRSTVGEILEKMYKKFAGNNFVGYYQFRTPTILLRDPELIKRLIIKEFNSFHDNPFSLDENLDPLASRNPFFSAGEKWKKTRSLLTPAFTSGKIKPMFPLMEKVCHEFKEYLEKEAPQSRPGGIDVKEVCGHFTTEVVASCAFGIHGNSFNDPEAEIRKMGRSLLAPGALRNILFMITLFLPSVTKFFRIRIMTVEVSNFFRRIVKEVVTHREKQNITKNDFLQLLLTLKHRGQLEEKAGDTAYKGDYTDEDITAHAVTFFTDGFETTSIALSFVLHELAVNPAVQERLRTEVGSVLANHGGQLSYDAIQEMSYLDMVVQETLRIHPPALFLEKICTRPCDISTTSGKTLTVEVGTHVIVPILAIHKDAEYFPEPKKFDPERFSEENKASMNRSAYLPFGYGPRQCLGMRFAQSTVKAGVAYLVSQFDIRSTRRTPIPLIQDPTYLFAAAKGGLWLDFVKRS